MRAVRFHDYGDSAVLRHEEVADAVAGPGQLLVRVMASSVNPVDWKVRSGAARAIVDYPLPVTTGGDIAGVVAALGAGVTGFTVGQRVFALVGLVGACAELVALDASLAAPMPAALGFEEAASLPMAALTVWQGLFGDGRSCAGQRVLIHNAAGGVGSVAVQIAKAHGATVLATASQANAAFVRALGADEVIDARHAPLDGRARDIDMLIDLVGNDDARRLWALVRAGGTVVRIAGGADADALAREGGLTVVKLRVKPDGAQLAEVAALAQSGALRPNVAAVFALSEVGQAQDLSRQGHTRGKIVIRLAS